MAYSIRALLSWQRQTNIKIMIIIILSINFVAIFSIPVMMIFCPLREIHRLQDQNDDVVHQFVSPISVKIKQILLARSVRTQLICRVYIEIEGTKHFANDFWFTVSLRWRVRSFSRTVWVISLACNFRAYTKWVYLDPRDNIFVAYICLCTYVYFYTNSIV